MSLPRPAAGGARFVPSHASETEYLDFLRESRYAEATIQRILRHRSRFVAEYPTLEDWLAAPLPERVGSLPQKRNPNGISRTSFMARPYLYFLALRGYARFDWEWLVAAHHLNLGPYLATAGLEPVMEKLTEEAAGLGYSRRSAGAAIQWNVARLFMRTGNAAISSVGQAEIEEAMAAVLAFRDREDVEIYFDSAQQCEEYTGRYRSLLHLFGTLLYHRGQMSSPPRRTRPRTLFPVSRKPRMESVAERYLTVRQTDGAFTTVDTIARALRSYVAWSAEAHPEVESFAEVTRDHTLEYAQVLSERISERTGRPLSVVTRRVMLGSLSVFFRDTAAWEWEEVPGRALLLPGDRPRLPDRVPRYIPEEQLPALMDAIRSLECPYRRAALLVARWSGARRDEIRRLEADCLDSYPDGTPRLRIPAGKTHEERTVPLNEEAAAALRELQALGREGRGLLDPRTGKLTRHLFMRYGKMLSASYLFETSLQEVCARAGIGDADGTDAVTAHRFRHTVGMQMAERDAKLDTIKKLLGHKSSDMTMTYAQISDREVLKDYQKVLGPGATIAGPLAQTLRGGELPTSDVEWIKANFYETELELGYCLRLPQEGPCQCELYFGCAKFVTTKEYAPRLRKRREREFELIEDAASNGWEREVERHGCTVTRIEQLLSELDEPVEENGG